MVLVREFTDQLNDFWVILCIDNPFTFLLCLCFTQVVVIRRALDLYMPSSMSSTHTPIYDISSVVLVLMSSKKPDVVFKKGIYS
jgi:hypothetical protein